eukprot:7218649-Pyramimonas_sp.AAC.1
MLQADVPEAIFYLGAALQARGCRLSPKSCIVSSVQSVGLSICSILGTRGWASKQVGLGRDLGLHITLGTVSYTHLTLPTILLV